MAMMPSPMNFSTSPPKRVISGAAMPQYASSTVATSAGDERSAKPVNPTRSAKENTHVLVSFPRRWQIEPPEPLIAPFATSSQSDDQVGRDDQAVPFPPTGVPLALPGERNTDHRLGEQHEAGNDSRGKQVPTVTEDAPVAPGTDRIRGCSKDRDHGE